MYLIDTNVVSELKRLRPHGAVLEWIKSIAADELRISAVTVGEIQAGIEITREQDKTKAREIELWLEQVVGSYQVLAIDAGIMREWARLMHNKPDDLYEDALIAATARIHGLTVVTRNVHDFENFAVSILNPFQHRSQI